MMISSQRHLDQSIVDEKIEAEDYVVTLVDLGNGMDLVIDGHHSLEAARQTGNEPEYVYATYNYQSEIDCLGLDDFLIAYWVDSDYYDIETGHTAF